MRPVLHGLVRALVYVLIVGGALVAATVLVLWLALPRVEYYKPQVEALVSAYLGQRISIDQVDAGWQGLELTLRAAGVRVGAGEHPDSGMHFDGMSLSFQPLRLLRAGESFERLELRGAVIEAARLADGRLRVGDTILGTPRGTLVHLLRGRSLVISDSTLVWRDALSPAPVLRIEALSLRIHASGARRRFEFTAAPPAGMVASLRGSGRYDPEQLGAGSWTGRMDVSVSQLDLAQLPQIIQEQLPWQSRGRVDAELHMNWVRGRLDAAGAELSAYDFVIPYARDKPPLSATSFSSELAWQRSDGAWRLVFRQPQIVLDGKTVSVSRFEIERQGERRTYSARDANVADLLGVIDKLQIELPWETLIHSLQPRGRFAQAALSLGGPYLEARDWSFEGNFKDVGWAAQPRFPGMQGVDGHLSVDAERGRLTLDSRDLTVDAARTLRAPVDFARVTGEVEWYRWDGDWVIDVDEGVIRSADLDLRDVNVYARIRPDVASAPYLLARLRIQRADLAALNRYLPVQRMPDKLAAWLEQALVAGEISRGRLYLNGPLDALPFDDGSGQLQLQARVTEGVLNFHDEWPDLENIDGAVTLDNTRFEARIEGARIMNSPVREAHLVSADLFRRDRLLRIDGSLTAQAADLIHFLRRGPLIKDPPPSHSSMAADGAGLLRLDIELPFTRLKQESRVQGEYRFEDLAVEVADGIEFTELAGAVSFTERSVSGEGLSGRLLGGPVTADLSTVEAGRPMTFAIAGSGRADVGRLAPVLGAELAERLAGQTRWSGRFVGGPGPDRLAVTSLLEGATIDLPAPLEKPAAAARPLEVDIAFDDARRRISLNLAERLTGTLHYGRDAGMAVLERGVLNLGATAPLPARGLTVAVRRAALDLDPWIAEIVALREGARQGDDAGPRRDGLFEHLRVLKLDVEELRYLGRGLGAVAVQARSPDSRAWTARLTGPRVAGRARLDFSAQPASYEFDLDRLYWPRLEKRAAAATEKEPPPDPAGFARLSISASDFRFGDMQLGALVLRAAPQGRDWVIHELSMRQPGLDIDIDGRWSRDRAAAHRTRVAVSLEADRLGQALTRLGFAGQVANGSADLDGDLNWPGPPGDFSLGRLGGELTFSAKDGRFLKLEPGSGRLLGLFNAETLVRRLQFDFADVFKEGLAFDHIDGRAAIHAGRLETDGIFIVGPAALIELTGSAHLGEETWDLLVTVAPQFGANLSLVSAIANPIAGAMLFVAQKLFKKQMARLINYKYRVSGDWSAPQVQTVRQAPPVQVPIGGFKP